MWACNVKGADQPDLYRHWQHGTILVSALGGVGVLLVVVGLFLPAELAVVLVVGLLLVALAFAFHGLGVEVDRSRLRVWFGPGWMEKTLDLSSIRGSRVVRNSAWMGWGIRYIDRGWMWNVSGLEAVELELADGSVFRIGSDAPEELHRAIQERLG